MVEPCYKLDTYFGKHKSCYELMVHLPEHHSRDCTTTFDLVTVVPDRCYGEECDVCIGDGCNDDGPKDIYEPNCSDAEYESEGDNCDDNHCYSYCCNGSCDDNSDRIDPIYDPLNYYMKKTPVFAPVENPHAALDIYGIHYDGNYLYFMSHSKGLCETTAYYDVVEKKIVISDTLENCENVITEAGRLSAHTNMENRPVLLAQKTGTLSWFHGHYDCYIYDTVTNTKVGYTGEPTATAGIGWCSIGNMLDNSGDYEYGAVRSLGPASSYENHWSNGDITTGDNNVAVWTTHAPNQRRLYGSHDIEPEYLISQMHVKPDFWSNHLPPSLVGEGISGDWGSGTPDNTAVPNAYKWGLTVGGQYQYVNVVEGLGVTVEYLLDDTGNTQKMMFCIDKGVTKGPRYYDGIKLHRIWYESDLSTTYNGEYLQWVQNGATTGGGRTACEFDENFPRSWLGILNSNSHFGFVGRDNSTLYYWDKQQLSTSSYVTLSPASVTLPDETWDITFISDSFVDGAALVLTAEGLLQLVL